MSVPIVALLLIWSKKMICKITNKAELELLDLADLKPYVLYEIATDPSHVGTIVIMNYLKNCLIALNCDSSWSWNNCWPTFKFRKFTGKIELSNE